MKLLRNCGLTAAAVLVLALVGAGAVAAQGEGPQPAAGVQPLVQILALLASGGGVGLVLAFLAERWPGFQALKPEVKFWVIFGVSIGLPLGAKLLLSAVPADVWAQIDPWWQVLAVSLVGWASSQGVYLGLIKPRVQVIGPAAAVPLNHDPYPENPGERG